MFCQATEVERLGVCDLWRFAFEPELLRDRLRVLGPDHPDRWLATDWLLERAVGDLAGAAEDQCIANSDVSRARGASRATGRGKTSRPGHAAAQVAVAGTRKNRALGHLGSAARLPEAGGRDFDADICCTIHGPSPSNRSRCQSGARNDARSGRPSPLSDRPAPSASP
jgi:hypothetical protein